MVNYRWVPMIELDRRTLLALGIGALAAGVSGCTGTAAAPTVPPPQTYAEWAARRKAPYYIAHRGAGTTIPEHSLPGYQRAIDWGADALEVSVVISSDGQLFCHHDLTLDRTTTLTGNTKDTTAAEFEAGRIRIPRLGPRWTGSGMPAIPRLTDALDAVGRKILCMEAKDDAAFQPMMKLLDQRGLLPQVMLKLGYTSSRIAQAKADGMPVFAYFGVAETVTAKALDKLGSGLTASDAIVLPTRATGGAYIDDGAVREATSGHVPVWVYPVHRRSEAAHFSDLGVSGFITPALGYLTGRVPVSTRDSFDTRQLAPGLTTRDPYSDWDAVGWNTADSIELIGTGARSVCLGDLSPVAAASGAYRVELDVCLVAGPMAPSDAFYLSFGCADDSYYPSASGYQLTLRQDGQLQLGVQGPQGVRVLGKPSPTAPLTSAHWVQLAVEVGPDKVSISRDGGEPTTVVDDSWRGGYLHVGRTGGAAKLAVRNVNVQS